ncbi:MAG: hypothetical protein PHY47_25240 [Lachnospiraceae bacterium]|nr:hypothetical protein [Lachnospiraceae bacterium]
MNRPWAYVSAAWDTNSSRAKKAAKKYCRTLYLEGYSPICPMLFQKEYLNDQVAEEHKDRLDMAEEFLRRSRILVVCGKRVDDTVQNDIAIAGHFRIPATILEAILNIEGGRE